MNKPSTIDEYLARVPAPQRALLQKLRKTIRKLAPRAEECMSYSIPAFRLDGPVVAGFAARGEGGSYYPFSGSTLAALAKEIEKYPHTKSALHFSAKQPLPVSLVRKLLRTRIAETKG